MPTLARILSVRLFLGATLLVGATSALTAQPVGPRGGQRGGPPPVEPGAPLGRPEAGPGAPMLRQRLAERPLGVTAIINLRRRFELTPRQLMQLDSIERGVAAQRTALMAQLRAEARRSGGLGAVPRGDARPVPDSVRARLAAIRPQVEQLRRTDSAATAAAELLLTEPQRAQLREARAFAWGRASAARGAGMRARGGMRGGMRGPMMGPRSGMGMRGGMGPRPGMGMGGRGWMGPGPQPSIRPGVRPRGYRSARAKQCFSPTSISVRSTCW
jgi:hypothetical protein